MTEACKVLKKPKIIETSVEIIDYAPQYARNFKAINIMWIQQYFEVEPVDEEVLSNPEKYIIKPGGHILFARNKETGQILGTCALMPHGDKMELTKMGVLPEARGKKVGNLLMNAVIEQARLMGLDEIFLETNSVLKPAIHLYEKYGFQHVAADPNSPYVRADVRMILKLS